MKEKELIFASANERKLERAKQLLASLDIQISCRYIPFKELEIDDIFVIAAEKALKVYEKTETPCIAMDTGFYIEDYPGCKNFPGAFIRRDLLDPMGVDGLLLKMQGVQNRTCCFRECLTYFDGYNLKSFEGVRYGQLTYEKRGESSLEAWSSLWSVFVPDHCDKTLAEMSEEERNSKQDGHTDAIEEFAKWYKSKERPKVLRKIS